MTVTFFPRRRLRVWFSSVVLESRQKPCPKIAKKNEILLRSMNRMCLIDGSLDKT